MPLRYSAEIGPLGRLRNDAAMRLRRRVFDAFMAECAPSPEARVADFGVSGQDDHPVHQFFEILYPHTHRLTAIGRASEGAAWYADRFPGLTYLEADLRAIPLPDGHFQAGICNAVVEHAGTREQQRRLVHEVCRVCQCVLFTTPNRSFPIELHTFLPFVHWLPDAPFRGVLRRLGFGFLADVENLNPLDARAFLDLFPAMRETRLVTLGGPLLRTNLACVSRIRSTP